MNWLIPGKLMAFASPYSMPVLPSGDRVATPEVVIPTFKELGINHIVRLNKQYYDAEDFRKENFKHTELYFLDGSIPPTKILNQFLDIIESDDVVALHCKAGLGRTGTLAACYMIKNFEFTARESIAWIRVCRPGSVIGPQQLYLVSYEENIIRERESKRVYEPSPEEIAMKTARMNIPQPPKSARILFVPNKGCPIPVDDDDDYYGVEPPNSARGYGAVIGYNRNRRYTRQSAREPRVKKPYKKDKNEKFLAMHALPMNQLHPQPRKINQKQPYWKTIGSYA